MIERPLDDELDISGWDLRKALNLMLAGNAVLGEWLRSPIVYRRDPLTDDLARLAAATLRRRPATWHYLNLAARQEARMNTADGIKLKALLYALRPALALRWMHRNDAAFPPMDMAALINGAAPPTEVIAATEALIALKHTRPEGGQIPSADPVLLDFIGAELAQARDWLARTAQMSDAPADQAAAEAFFRRVVRAV